MLYGRSSGTVTTEPYTARSLAPMKAERFATATLITVLMSTFLARHIPLSQRKPLDSVRRGDLNFGLMRPVITDHFSFRFPYQWRTCPVTGSCQSLLITATAALTAHRSFPLMNEIAIGSLKYSFQCFTGRCPIISPTTDHL